MAPKGGFFRLENAVWRFSNYGFEKGLSKWRELKCSTSSHDNWQFYYNYQTSSSTTLSILNSATVNLHVWGTTSFWAKVSVELDSDNRVWPEKKIIPYIIRQVWSNFVFGDRSFNFLEWVQIAQPGPEVYGWHRVCKHYFFSPSVPIIAIKNVFQNRYH